MANEDPKQPVEKYQFLRSAGRFTRMKKRGAIPPPIRVIQAVIAVTMKEFEAEIAEIAKAVSLASASSGVRIAGTMDAEAGDYDLIIDAMRERLGRRVKGDVVDPNTVSLIKKQFLDAQQDFFREFEEDADEETKARVVAAISRGDTFRNRLDTIERGYLKDAIEKISEGKSRLRNTFINIFGDWIRGMTPDLKGLDEVMEEVRGEAGRFSRFFARDQFSRFNRALTVSIYEEAGAKWVQWVTVGDGRVRPTHRALRNKIFRIDDLPEEYLGFLCRCSLLPVFDLRGRTVTRGNGVSMTAKL